MIRPGHKRPEEMPLNLHVADHQVNASANTSLCLQRDAYEAVKCSMAYSPRLRMRKEIGPTTRQTFSTERGSRQCRST